MNCSLFWRKYYKAHKSTLKLTKWLLWFYFLANSMFGLSFLDLSASISGVSYLSVISKFNTFLRMISYICRLLVFWECWLSFRREELFVFLEDLFLLGFKLNLLLFSFIQLTSRIYPLITKMLIFLLKRLFISLILS